MPLAVARPLLDTASARAATGSTAGARRVAQQLAAALLTPSRLALGRTGIGVAMLTAPTRTVVVLGGDEAAARASSWATQMLGAREIALGLGAFVALRRPDRRPARLWVAAGLLADTVDALAVARATGRGDVQRGPGAVLTAVAVTAVGIQTAALIGTDLR